MEEFHGDLYSLEVTVGVEFASLAEDDEGPSAVVVNGYPVPADVRVTPLRQRLHGVPDAVLTVDRRWYRGAGEATQVALFDHHLCRLKLARDAKGAVRSDDLGRPKLEKVLCDWSLCGFEAVLRRHGQAALEAQLFRRAVEDYDLLPFARDPDDAPVTAGADGRPSVARA
jgi:hypothetical protein